MDTQIRHRFVARTIRLAWYRRVLERAFLWVAAMDAWACAMASAIRSYWVKP